MLGVGDFQVDDVGVEGAFAVDELEVEDVRLGRAEDVGDGGQRAGLVLDDDGEAGGAALGLAVPAQVHPVVILLHLQRSAVDGVDLDRLPGAAHADDAVAGHGMAAIAQIIGDAGGEAADRHGFMLARMGFLHPLRAGGAGDQRLHHFMVEHAVGGDGDHQRGAIVELEALERRGQRLVAQFLGEIGREAADDFLIEFLAQLDFLAALLLADEAADGGARLARDGEGEPAGLRLLPLRLQYFDLVAIVEGGAQRHDAAVDLGPHGLVAQAGVDGKSTMHQEKSS